MLLTAEKWEALQREIALHLITEEGRRRATVRIQTGDDPWIVFIQERVTEQQTPPTIDEVAR